MTERAFSVSAEEMQQFLSEPVSEETKQQDSSDELQQAMRMLHSSWEVMAAMHEVSDGGYSLGSIRLSLLGDEGLLPREIEIPLAYADAAEVEQLWQLLNDTVIKLHVTALANVHDRSGELLEAAFSNQEQEVTDEQQNE